MVSNCSRYQYCNGPALAGPTVNAARVSLGAQNTFLLQLEWLDRIEWNIWMFSVQKQRIENKIWGYNSYYLSSLSGNYLWCLQQQALRETIFHKACNKFHVSGNLRDVGLLMIIVGSLSRSQLLCGIIFFLSPASNSSAWNWGQSAFMLPSVPTFHLHCTLTACTATK